MSKREENRTPGSRELSATGAAGVRILLLLVIVVGAGAIYEASRCSGPLAGRPLFGTFTIHCEWRDRTVRSLNLYDYLTDTRPRFDPITRALINHMALKAARAELNRLGPTQSAAEIDVLVFGRILPFGMAVCATQFSNPRVVSLKPRPFTGNPPVDAVLPCRE
jgi:hypothetical protein